MLSKVPAKNFPRTDLGDIYQVERTERRVTLGASLYDAMLADLIDYSAAPAWASGGSYALNDKVVYQGIVYNSLTGSNTSEPPAKGSWEPAAKFADENFEALWCLFLGRYLALHVVAVTIPTQAVRLSGSGVVQPQSQVHRPAAKEGVNDLASAVLAEIVRVFENMHEYLNGSDADVFSGYAGKAAALCPMDEVYSLTGGERFFYGTVAEEEPEQPATRHRLNANIYRLG